jgi:hypothetical protein
MTIVMVSTEESCVGRKLLKAENIAHLLVRCTLEFESRHSDLALICTPSSRQGELPTTPSADCCLFSVAVMGQSRGGTE